MIKPNVICLILLFFCFSILSTASSPPPVEKGKIKLVRQAFMERSPGQFDPDLYVKQQRELYHRLIADAPGLSAESVTTLSLTPEERMRLESDQCIPCGKNRLSTQQLRVGIAKHVGMNVDISSGRSNNGTLSMLPDGGFAWTTVIETEDATALRVHFENVSLPANAALYVYNLNGEAFGPYGPESVKNGHIYTETVNGSILFVQLRSSGPAAGPVRFVISDVGYMGEKFLLPFLLQRGNLPEDVSRLDVHCAFNEPCIEDATCYDTTDWAQIDDVRMSIASILYQSGLDYYICSGGLVADTDLSTQIPYFITANHCISTTAEANSMVCYWQFWTASCQGTCFYPWGVVPQTNGGTILSTSDTEGDYTLLQLAQTPPAGSIYMGWNNTAIDEVDAFPLYRISHPQMAPQAYSTHQVDYDSWVCPNRPRGEWIYSEDLIGATEGGSSGSPVFNTAGQIVGQLTGACGYDVNNPCNSVQNRTIDGAFAHYYPFVQPWLDPVLIPADPTGLSRVSVGCTTVSLAWTDNSDNEDGFIIERRTQTGTFAQVGTNPADDTTFTDSTAAMGTYYQYRVKAYNGAGDSGYSNTVAARTLQPPAAPIRPSGTQTGNSEVTLTWTDPTPPNPTSISASAPPNEGAFLVYRYKLSTTSISLNPWKLIAKLKPNTTSYVDTGITGPGTYYYKVCSVNKCGEVCARQFQVTVL